MTTDPNAPLQPDDPEPVVPQAPPEPPSIDLDAAYRVVADNEGWDPRVARFEMQEFKRRREEFEREKREFQERNRQPEPTPDFGGDQYARWAYEARQDAAETKRMLLEEREERRREKEKSDMIDSLGGELTMSYNALGRQSGVTKEQLKAQETEFFALLTEMYPEPDMLQRIGADRAVRNAFRVFQSNGGYTPPRPTYRDPRAQIVLPGAPTGTTGGASMANDDSGPQRPGETVEQALERTQRRLQALQSSLGRGLPDGMRVSSG